MKTFNDKHQTLIDIYLDPIAANPVEGEIVTHQKIVYNLHYFKQHFDINGNEMFLKIQLPRDFIIDLYNHIQQIESEKIDTIYHGLPF